MEVPAKREDTAMPPNKQIEAIIQWNFTPPEPGIVGSIDRFIGPGMTNAELWVQAMFTIPMGLGVLAHALLARLDWNPLQLVVATLIAMDMAGGIITNATSPAKRWYHRPGQGFQQHFLFVVGHTAHVFLVSWLFRSLDWHFFLVITGYLLCSAVLVLWTELYLQRPMAFGLFGLSILINCYVVQPTVGLEWFVPFLFLKLLVCHLLREEPYRPNTES